MDLSEIGVRPVTLRELGDMGLDLSAILDMPLGYSQSNGTIALREELTSIYPGASVDQVEVTNGTSEANYLLALALLRQGDEVAFEVPNYMQYGGVPQSLGATVNVGSAVSMRLIADPNNWDKTQHGITLGESGIPSSPHWKDQLEDWRNVTPRLFPFSRAVVESAAKETLILEPAK